MPTLKNPYFLLLQVFATLPFSDCITVRFCVVNNKASEKVEKLAKEVKSWNSSFDVIPIYKHEDPEGCFEAIKNDQADIISIDSGDVATVMKEHDLEPIAAERYGNHEKLYAVVVAVVKSISKDSTRWEMADIIGRPMCSPGSHTATGWILPMSIIMQNEVFKRHITSCYSAAQVGRMVFNDSCIPDNDQSGEPCNLYENHLTYMYSGFHGAFQCLKKASGYFAFLSHLKVNTIFSDRNVNNPDFYELLCPDGSVARIDNYKNCNWGEARANVVVASKSSSKKTALKEFLVGVAERFGPKSNDFRLFGSSGSPDLLFSDETTSLVSLDNGITAEKYLGEEFMNRSEILNKCPVEAAIWCTLSEQEQKKCKGLAEQKSMAKVKPHLKCVKQSNVSECFQAMKKGKVNLMTVDSGDAFIGVNCHGLKAIAEEVYADGVQKVEAIAVVKRFSHDISLYNMNPVGEKPVVCFSGRDMVGGNLAGMKEVVKNQYLAKTSVENSELGMVFQKGCLPGTDDLHSSMCAACSNTCAKSHSEKYFGNTGAFRCLVEDAGSLAFTTRQAVLDNTESKNSDRWARSLVKDDYRLLCKDGTQRKFTDADEDLEKCILSDVKSPFVVTSGTLDEAKRDILWEFLDNLQKKTTPDTLFTSEDDNYDLMFTENTKKLKKVNDGDLQVDKDIESFLKCPSTCSPSSSIRVSPFLQWIILLYITTHFNPYINLLRLYFSFG